MQRRSPSFYKKRRAKSERRFPSNEYIRSDRIILIDESGNNLGEIDLAEALRIGEEKDLDVIAVQPNANPPVCKLADYGQFQYQQEKVRRKQQVRQKKVELKGIRLSLRISDHDKEVRQNQAKKFLEQGDKIKIDIVLRGREKSYADQGKDIMENFIKNIGDDVFIEQPFARQGGKISMVVVKKS